MNNEKNFNYMLSVSSATVAATATVTLSSCLAEFAIV